MYVTLLKTKTENEIEQGLKESTNSHKLVQNFLQFYFFLREELSTLNGEKVTKICYKHLINLKEQ